MRTWLAGALLGSLALAALSPGASASPSAIAVLDFYDLSQGTEWRWLGKGLADMSITDLGAVQSLQVLDRERMQAYRRELALHGTGLLDDAALLEFGRTARADRVVFGTYLVGDDDHVTIQATVVNVQSREVETTATVEGQTGNLFSVQDALVKKLIDGLDIDVGVAEARRLTFQWTESLDAAAHFYTAFDHYDRGELELALAEARFANRIDSSYLPARYWVGRLYLELAEYEHAELALDTLLAVADDRSYLVHTRLLIAELHRKHLGQIEQAIPHLEAVGRWLELSVEQLNVRFRLGQLYFESKAYARAYEVFRRLATIRGERSIKGRAPLPYKSVSMLSPHEIRTASIEKYQSAFLNAHYHTSSSPAPSEEMILLTPENPEFRRIEHIGDGSRSRSEEDTRPLFYVPRGLRFKAFTLQFRGPQTQISVRPYVHYTKDFSQVGLKSNLPDPEGGLSTQRYIAAQELIRAVIFDAHVGGGSAGTFSWSIRAEFMPADAPQPGSVTYWSNLLEENTSHPILLDTPGHQASDVSLLEDREGALWAVYDTNKDLDEDAGDSDIWYFQSSDKQHWQAPRALRAVNSVADDYAPDLLQDDSGRFLLVFVSDRRGQDELWIASSINGRRWYRPRRVRVKEGDGEGELDRMRSPRLFQDRNGRFRLAFFHVPSGQVVLTASRDLVHWDDPVALPVDLSRQSRDDVTIEFLQDRTAVYRLVVSASFAHDAPMLLGSSTDATRWTLDPSPFKGNSHPAVVHDQDGRFALVFSNNGEGSYYLHQIYSDDWHHWSDPELLPRIHYFADTHMARADIVQTRDGYYWLAVPRSYGHRLQLFRLQRFPATTVGDVYVRNRRVGRAAREQLDREEAKLRALKAGDKELARCLSRARHYQSCLRGARS